MYKLCSTEQTASRQRQLELTLLEELQKTPFEEISVTNLCRKAGVPRKAFYRYFDDKTGALYALMDHYLLFTEEQMLRKTGELSLTLQDLVPFLTHCRDYPNLFRAVISNKLWDEMIDRMMDNYWRNLSPEGAPAEENSYGQWFLLGGILGIINRWYKTDFAESPEIIADSIIRSIRRVARNM